MTGILLELSDLDGFIEKGENAIKSGVVALPVVVMMLIARADGGGVVFWELVNCEGVLETTFLNLYLFLSIM